MRYLPIILMALLAAPWWSDDYFTHTRSTHYPTEYYSPPSTGYPAAGYYYPSRYVDSTGWFRQYRQYTHAAYRHPGIAYSHQRHWY